MDAGRAQMDAGRAQMIACPVVLRVTPHGSYGAPRYMVGGASTWRAPSLDAKPHHYHQGIDVIAPVGSPVLACAPGMVVQSEPGLGKVVVKLALDDGTGNRFLVNGKPVFAIYADLGPVKVKPGDRVAAGQPIAEVWHEGFVHFAIRLEAFGEYVDPATLGLRWQVG